MFALFGRISVIDDSDGGLGGKGENDDWGILAAALVRCAGAATGVPAKYLVATLRYAPGFHGKNAILHIYW